MLLHWAWACILAAIATRAHAASLQPSVQALVYTVGDYCPDGTTQNWTSVQMDDVYRGRVILGSDEPGGLFGNAIRADDRYPTHSHGGWALKTKFTKGAQMGLDGNDDNEVADVDVLSIKAEDDDNYILKDSGNLPYVPLVLCRYDTGCP